MEHIYDMIIIGGGPSGYTAALYATRAGFDTLVIEKISPGGQMALTGVIDNYPGFDEGIEGFDLGMKMMQQAERFGAKTEYAEVVSVAFEDKIKTVETTGGIYRGKTIIIATGAKARELGVPKEKEYIGRGVHYCAHCDGRFYKDKTVVVVGGGNSAAADALYLSRLAKKVIIIHRRDKLRATRIYHEPLMNCDNVEFHWNSKVSEILADGLVKGVKIVDVISGEENTLQCDGIFVSIGRIPISEFVKSQIDIDDNGYIIADETTRTNIEGVFAVGDVRTKALRQIITAAADGAVAVHYAEEYILKE